MTRRDDHDGWYEAEQPLFQAVVAELRRLKNRARARVVWVLLITAVLTAGFMYKRLQKVKIHRAVVVLSVTEGMLSQGQEPMPVQELREYVLSVLLTDADIAKIVEERDLWPLRKKQGMQYAISEFRDALVVYVKRNYFLYEYEIESPRSARIAIGFEDPDSERSWEIVHEVANHIIDAQHERTMAMASEMSRQASLALADAQAESAQLEEQVAAANVEVARAERDGDPRLASLRLDTAELDAQLFHQHERMVQLARQADADQNAAAIVRAGLAISFEISEEVRAVDPGPPPAYFQIILAGVFYCLALPMVAVFIGAFDTRIHDGEDVERIGLPVLGHLPGFPGDRVGSLRARGIRRRRVPS